MIAEAGIFYALALNEAADPADKTYVRPNSRADAIPKSGGEVSRLRASRTTSINS